MTTSEGTRRVTAADVARSLGVSRATVGFVLNQTPGQTISEATRRRVLDEAERLGYRPHAGAQALARGRSNLALLVLPDWPIDFALRVNLEEAARLLEDAGYTLVSQARHGDELIRPLWRTLQPDVVLGMLPFSEQELRSIRAAGVPRVIPSSTTLPREDDVPGASLGARIQEQHLHERGHVRLGYARTDDPRLAWLQERRLQAAIEECERLHLQPPVVTEVGTTPEDGNEAIRRWQQSGVTAILGYNDEVAARALAAALRAGVRVPDELAVIGHDDTPLAALLFPSLSSVRIDQASLGRHMAELMLDAVGALGHEVMRPEVHVEAVLRETT